MKEEVLYIGDVKAFNRPVVMKCHGLGSCIGLFVKDRVTGITAGAHIFMPEACSNNFQDKPYAVQEAVNVMLSKMKALGSDLLTLRAKVVGGANLFAGLYDIGALNIQGVKEHLLKHKIFIAATDVGGSISRTAQFEAHSEKLVVNGKELQESNYKPVHICQKAY
jgi:chemotaxis protein CheD